MSKRSTYKRILPSPPAVAFSSAQGKQYMIEALADGTMESFFALIEQFHTQDEPAFCGLASLAMVLNALQVDPKRKWKGPWRWFNESMLDCCKPLSEILKEGVTLDQAACLARCNGAKARLIRQTETTLDDFTALLRASCSSSNEHLIVSYTRKTFLQTGDGHFSPIGGYHAASNSVLILDVARFKYPSHWVPVPLLYDAMEAPDQATGKSRGFLILESNSEASSVLFTVNRNSKGGFEILAKLRLPVTEGILENSKALQNDLLRRFQLADVSSFLKTRENSGGCQGCGNCVQDGAVAMVLEEIHGTELFSVIKSQLEGAQSDDHAHFDDSYLAEKLTLLWLVQDTFQENKLSGALSAKDGAPSNFSLGQYQQILKAEVAYLASQMRALPELQMAFKSQHPLCGCSKKATS